ncbi:type IV pilus assembly PilZ [Desulfarculus baarsii DSM 2075]|uniref:Type IV pilus assembly PilZ n=1 Tax=Desulfarculus baarsii (strain ATCC 33931 / DSM 2075 / LMG 7858 / VKM B-1802 / 2st14) TaxID=644282 RepID=E1QIX0_DESB2|nr:PilZ domain-containing protein [Desulfarculus baarsii]ADK85513.1 type IV pilus assembly PilZ [Desulfarculus baarsii DSM 2075]
MASHRDKRKTQRYSAAKEAFVFLRPTFVNLGRVVDLSDGGAGLEYIADKGIAPEWAEVDIVLSDSGTHISRVPCRIVHDSPLDDQAMPLGLETRRCGLQWGELTPRQQVHLKACTSYHGKFNA